MSEVETRLADRVDAWLQVCGACDAGMYECTHPNEDPRTMIGDLWDEVTRLRDQLARVRTEAHETHEELIDILQPLVNYLCDNHPDRYGGRHCIDVAIELLNEAARVRTDTIEQIEQAVRNLDWKYEPVSRDDVLAAVRGVSHEH